MKKEYKIGCIYKMTFLLTILFYLIKVNAQQISLQYSIGGVSFTSKNLHFVGPLSYDFRNNCLTISNGVVLFNKPGTQKFTITCINAPRLDSILVDSSFKLINSVVIYPNPVTDNVVVKYSTNKRVANVFYIKIYNASGVLINQIKTTEQVLIDGFSIRMLAYASGIYFVNVASNNFNRTFKIIKS